VRGALVLHEIARLTYAEIAETQRVPVPTVTSRIARGRQGMALLLAEPDPGTAAHP
jgi:DNA-directed RNA polymerase specialized sigma24 family protein